MVSPRTLGCCLVVATTVAFARPVDAQIGPEQTVKAANDSIRLLLKKTPPITTDAKVRSAHRDKLRALVNELLDLDQMARDALGRHWSKRTPAEQTEFSTLLKQLVERSYLRSLKKNLDYTVTFGATNTVGLKARVHTNLRVKTSTGPQEVPVIYHLHQRENRWQVTEIVTDTAHMVRGYRTTINGIMRRQGFEAVLQRLQKRLANSEEVI